MRPSMMIDLTKCVGCQACVTACMERWNTDVNAKRNWVYEYESGDKKSGLNLAFYPGLCMQCDDHPCTEDCPSGATYMDKATGIVMVNKDVCIGCGNCISNCVYDARSADNKKGIVEKCNLCAPYVAKGEQPACITTCMGNCRYFGDKDDLTSEVVVLSNKKGAQPLKTAALDYKPKTLYAGDIERKIILQNTILHKPEKSLLTKSWVEFTKPFAAFVVPSVVFGTIASGLLLNYKARIDKISKEKKSNESNEPNEPKKKSSLKNNDTTSQNDSFSKDATLFRHQLGIRLLHWFNLASWIILLTTGTAIMSSQNFALFGTEFPKLVANIFGGAASVLKLHVVWGIIWALIIVPLFLLFKKGGRRALSEIKLTKDDLLWIKMKPFAILGLSKKPLPPQDKYNAGQKLLALAILMSTSTIIITGLVMSFHVGSSFLVAVSIMVHKFAIAMTLLGLGVHVMMAIVLKEERPAFKSMITGHIDASHAEKHNAKWANKKKVSNDKS